MRTRGHAAWRGGVFPVIGKPRLPIHGWEHVERSGQVSETNGRFRRATPRKKTSTVKRVTVSDETRKRYEEIVRTRDEREQTYGRHLSEDQKTKR